MKMLMYISKSEFDQIVSSDLYVFPLHNDSLCIIYIMHIYVKIFILYLYSCGVKWFVVETFLKLLQFYVCIYD